MVHVAPVKGKGISQIQIILGFLTQNGSGCPSQGKSMSQIGLTWGNEKFGFWVMCPWIPIGNEKCTLV